MDLLIRVRWKNGSHPLLQRGDGQTKTVWHAPGLPNVATTGGAPTIEVIADGGVPALNQNWTENSQDFVLKDPQSTVSVSITFAPWVVGIQAETLSANQTYTLSGENPVESSATVGPTGGSTTTVTKHPLVSVVKEPPGAAGQTAFTVTIDTTFVDATEHWQKLCATRGKCLSESFSCWEAYRKLHEAGTELAVLGYTDGAPAIWFALVPDACKSAGSVSALVFFRPAAGAYASIHGALDAMYALTRYVLRPRSPDPGVWWAWDRYHMITDAQFDTVKHSADPPAQFYDRLCAGFENALGACGKPVMLLYPLPSGTSFGAAQGPKLAGGTRSKQGRQRSQRERHRPPGCG